MRIEDRQNFGRNFSLYLISWIWLFICVVIFSLCTRYNVGFFRSPENIQNIQQRHNAIEYNNLFLGVVLFAIYLAGIIKILQHEPKISTFIVHSFRSVLGR
jgi:ABC-type multidrug transport system permease subunit